MNSFIAQRVRTGMRERNTNKSRDAQTTIVGLHAPTDRLTVYTQAAPGAPSPRKGMNEPISMAYIDD